MDSELPSAPLRSFNVNAPAFSPLKPEQTTPEQAASRKSPSLSPETTSETNSGLQNLVQIEYGDQPPNSQNQGSATGARNNARGRRNQKSSASGSSTPQQKASTKGRNRNNNSNSHPRGGDNPARKSSTFSGLPGENEIDFIENVSTLAGKGKRGQVSISHLLQFSLPTRPQGAAAQLYRPRRSSNNGMSKSKYGMPPPDNLTYVNTSCRFILDPQFQDKYQDLLHNPDAQVPMNHVLRVLSRSWTCPICLDDAKAPRMLHCGHVMCYPCFLRFMDNNNHKEADAPTRQECPLCFELVEPEKLKPVTFLEFDEKFDTPRTNTETAMRLMFRPQSTDNDGACMNAMPISLPEISPEMFNSIPIVSDSSYMYPRLMLPTREYLLAQYENEIKDLETQRDEEALLYPDDQGSVGRFFNAAIRKIRVAVAEATSGSKYDLETIKKGQRYALLNAENLHLLAHDDDKEKTSVTAEHYLSKFNDTSAYYFYQTAFQSETRYVLSPLDARILQHEFHAYHSMPSSIVVRIENIVHGNYMTPELRKRFKFLGHLPYYTDIAFIECDWLSHSKAKNGGKKKDDATSESLEPADDATPAPESQTDGLLRLSKPTLDHFRKELQHRSEELRRKSRREKNQARKYQDTQDRKLYEDLWSTAGISGGPQSHAEYQESYGSTASFPTLGTTKTIANVVKGGSTVDNDQGPSSSNEPAAPQATEPPASPPQASLENTKNAALYKKKTVWGTETVVYKSTIEEERAAQARAGLGDGWFDYSSILAQTTPKPDDASQGSSKGKRKGKKLVLMSTGRAMY